MVDRHPLPLNSDTKLKALQFIQCRKALVVCIWRTIVGKIMHLMRGFYIVFVWFVLIGPVASTDSELLMEKN